MEIKLYNSLSKKIEPFKPLKENIVSMYSCGPTVYNYAHIGNMRSFLFADLLQRVLKVVGGYQIKWVMNITNIDDKTIRDSAKSSREWLPEMGVQTDDPMINLNLFTNYYEKSFIDDITKLGVNVNHFAKMPRATDYIPHMQDLIKRIVRNGFGYVSEGSVYFNVAEWRKIDIYGKLFKIDFENFRTGERIDADQYEREEVSDFVLWKARKPGEPYWAFEVDGKRCDGRPGWHIECSAMEYELLKLPFDIHTGGIDLKFPHHEDEIAQSKAGYGVEPTVYWCHNEFLEVEGEKMSKSKGNFFTLRDLIAKGIDPIDIRFAMFSVHYSSVYNFKFEGINAARKARLRIQDFIYSLFEKSDSSYKQSFAEKLKEEVFNQLSVDLHTPKALSIIFQFINRKEPKKFNEKTKESLIHLFSDLNRIFEVWEIAPRKTKKIEIPKEIFALAEKRFKAKKEKNFEKADKLRQKIIDAGFVVKDTKDSYIIEHKTLNIEH